MILRIIAGLLPAGALFLPLGIVNISIILLGNTEMRLDIVELIRLSGNLGGDELIARLIQSDLFAKALPWVYTAVAGLAIGILAILAGIALSFTKANFASVFVYAGGLAGAVVMAVGFGGFGSAMESNLLFTVDTTVGAGSYLLMGLFLLGAGVCLLRHWEIIKS